MSAAKPYILAVLRKVARHLPPHWLLHTKLPLLPFYHAVGNADELPHIRHLYRPRSEAEFRQDMEYIARYFEVVDLSDFLIRVKTGNFQKAGKPIFHLSFDDGLRQVYDVAMPILEKMGIPATIFINPDFVDNKELFFRYKVSLIIAAFSNSKMSQKTQHKIVNLLLSRSEWDVTMETIAENYEVDFNAFLKEYKPYMTIPQLKDALSRGFSIGGHSMNHPYYYKINEKEQIQQSVQSIDWVEKHLNTDYRVFSFPFTDDGVGEGFFQHIATVSDATFACAGIKPSAFVQHWQRLGMEGAAIDAATIIKGEYLYRKIRGGA